MSLLGGYEDKNGVSKEITNMILKCMTSNPSVRYDLIWKIHIFKQIDPRFILCHACIGNTNTKTDSDGNTAPKVYGGGVDVATGQVFSGTFRAKVSWMT